MDYLKTAQSKISTPRRTIARPSFLGNFDSINVPTANKKIPIMETAIPRGTNSDSRDNNSEIASMRCLSCSLLS